MKRELGFMHGVDAPIFVDKANRIPIVAKFDPKQSEYVAEVVELPNRLIQHWGMTFGDAVHNLRSALDHLVWQLALVQTNGAYPTNPRDVFFPIRPSKKAFESHKVWRHISTTHQGVLSKYQPYSGTNGVMIAKLHSFDIDDKHRILTPVLLPPLAFDPFALYEAGVKVQSVTFVGGEPLEVGAEITRIGVWVPPGVQPPAEVSSNLTPQVQVAGTGGEHPVKFLGELKEAVVAVLSEFS